MSGSTQGERNDRSPALNAISTPKVCVSTYEPGRVALVSGIGRPPRFHQGALEVVARQQLRFSLFASAPRDATHDAFDGLDRRIGVVNHREFPLPAIRTLDGVPEVRREDGEPGFISGRCGDR